MNNAASINAYFETNNGWSWTEVAERKIGEWCVTYREVGDDGIQTERRIAKLAPCKEAAVWAAAMLNLEISDSEPGWYSVRRLDFSDHAN